MHLIQIFLPLTDNDGKAFPRSMFRTVRDELTRKFGGMTGHTRAPVEGLWKDEGAETKRDDLLIFEVMTEAVDPDWWRQYRQELEASFKQEQIVVRSQHIDLL